MSFPVIYGPFISLSAWCGSVSIAMFQGLGPFAGSLINRFGCRVMSIIGCLICAVSLTITSFATHLITLYVSYVCLGVGGAFTFLSCLEIVRRSFEKWRSIALGIASAGQGLGTMVLSQVVSALVIVVGWRNSMRILAGALAVNSLFGFLYGSTSATDDSSKKLLINTSVEKRKSKRFSLNLSVFKVPSFLVVAATFFFTMFGRPIVYVLLVSIIELLSILRRKALLFTLNTRFPLQFPPYLMICYLVCIYPPSNFQA